MADDTGKADFLKGATVDGEAAGRMASIIESRDYLRLHGRGHGRLQSLDIVLDADGGTRAGGEIYDAGRYFRFILALKNPPGARSQWTCGMCYAACDHIGTVLHGVMEARAATDPDYRLNNWFRDLQNIVPKDEEPARQDRGRPFADLGLQISLTDGYPFKNLLVTPVLLEKKKAGGYKKNVVPLQARQGRLSTSIPDGLPDDAEMHLMVLLSSTVENEQDAGRRSFYDDRRSRAFMSHLGAKALRALGQYLPFFIDEDRRPIRLGPTRNVSVAWDTQGDGKQKLVCLLDLQPKNFEVVHGGGHWYIDYESGEIGPATGAIAAIPLVESAPALSPKDAIAAHARLRNKPITRLIPLPKTNASIVDVAGLEGHRVILGKDSQERLCLDLKHIYGSDFVVGASTAEEWIERGGVTYVLRHDVVAERQAATTLSSLVNVRAGGPEPGRYFLLDAADEVLKKVPALRQAGFDVRFDPAFPLTLLEAPAQWEGHAEAEDDGDKWLSISLGVVIDGRAYDLVPIIQRVVRQGLIAIDPVAGEPETVLLNLEFGVYVHIPTARLRGMVAPLVQWLERGTVSSKGRLRIRRIEALDFGRDVWVPNAALYAVIADLRSPRLPVAIPESFKGTLKDFQHEAVEWLGWISKAKLGAILADEQRLGKSVITLAHVAAEKAAGRMPFPVLIVGPATLVGTWETRIRKFLPDSKSLQVWDQDTTLFGLARRDLDFVIISWAMLRRRINELEQFQFSLCIRDEVQDIKNHQTATVAELKRIKADRHLSLSGTPWENKYDELWAQIDSVEPGLLGTFESFTRNYKTPIMNKDPEAMRRLQGKISLVVLRRTRAGVNQTYTTIERIPIHVTFGQRQRDFYESLRLVRHAELKKVIATRGIALAQGEILNAITFMRRACADPRLVGDTIPAALAVGESAKLTELRKLCEEVVAKGQKALIFSQWTSMLTLIEQDIMAPKGWKYLKLVGSVAAKKRPKLCEEFQLGSAPFFLISLKSGNRGLDLDGADMAIMYDQWWNPYVEDQAVDRIVAQDDPGTKYRYQIHADKTIEDQVEELKARKRDLMDAIWVGGVAKGVAFTVEEVDYIFGEQARAPETWALPKPGDSNQD